MSDEIAPRKNRAWIFFLLLAIVLAGIFVRTWHFEEWLYFQGDQVRDAMLVGKVVENGPGWLPLLGPKAGGTSLRLGPIFYYFQYLSGTLFHSTDPHVFAYPDLFFGILAIPLLYLFLKEFFSINWSLTLAFGYAVCFFAVQYSRFAWNPNSLPFFNLLFFFAVYKFLAAGNHRKKWAWTFAAAIAYAVASQLHFVSLLALPIATAIIAFGFKRINQNAKLKNMTGYILAAIGIIAILYIPVILSDISTHGDNTLSFFESFGSKSSALPLWKLAEKEMFNFFQYALVILSGIINSTKTTYYIAGACIFFGFISSSFLIPKRRLERNAKIFLLVAWAWLVSYVIVYFPTAKNLDPRHFLVVAPLFFIVWGFIAFALFGERKSRFVSVASLVFLLIPAFSNAWSVKTWFSELSASQAGISSYRKADLLKSVGGESWWHLESIANFMRQDCRENELIIVPPKKISRSRIAFAMKHVGETRPVSIAWKKLSVYPNACYFTVHFSKNAFSGHFHDKYKMDKLYSQEFGDMTVTRFSLIRDAKSENIDASSDTDSPDAAESILESESKTDSEDSEAQSETETSSAISPPPLEPKITPRVFWKDLWAK